MDYDFVLGVNICICSRDNKPSVVINSSNILSALGVQQWYNTAELQAAAVLRSLVIGHGFQDGNKRTAAVVADSISSIKCSDTAAEQCIIDIATGRIKSVEEIAKIIFCDQDVITSAIIYRYKGYDIGIDETSTDNQGLYYATKGSSTYYADTEEEIYDLIDNLQSN